MDKRTLIDEIHALLFGSLTADEAGELRERCAADPEAGALLKQYEEVFALTRPADVEPPPCELRFDVVERALVPQPAWRMVLRRTVRVAAAVLVLVVGAYALTHVLPGRGAGPAPLTLTAIPLVELVVTGDEPKIPEQLATYRPVKDGVQWITSYETAQELAKGASRPVLLFQLPAR